MLRTLCAVSLAISVLAGCGGFAETRPTTSSSGHPGPGVVTGSDAAAAMAQHEDPPTLPIGGHAPLAP